MRFVTAIVFVFLSCGHAAAQVDKSNLTGIIRDASGAAIPEATITVTNKDTGAVRTEKSDASGFYRFTLIDRGSYRMQVERAGFKRFVQETVQLQTGETTTIDIALTIGELAESITVTS